MISYAGILLIAYRCDSQKVCISTGHGLISTSGSMQAFKFNKAF